MPVNVIALIYRNPNVPPEEFKIRYEAHIELIKRVAGETFPLVHRRSYLARTPGLSFAGEGEGGRPATLFAGQQSDFAFDAVVELTFENQAAFQAFSGRIYSPNVIELLGGEEGFMDRRRLGAVLVSQVVETRRAE
ncbi:hypothetical protein PISL3812_02030 [Talaromyces islandicus]|uniref:EthD domain-containing protein n=1 Tax=Talaromyces islandicus TaxID=28573 RepID=A0A0U1LNS7_TALIS|nr:hypothetical protein PISL3812_02030 [Talaromyces islandicus]